MYTEENFLKKEPVPKGVVIVRLGDSEYMPPKFNPLRKDGALFITVKYSSNGASYSEKEQIPYLKFRLATNFEIEQYNLGYTNINDIPVNWLNNFSVLCNKNFINYKLFKEICKKHNIPFDFSFMGSSVYYGIKKSLVSCGEWPWGKCFKTVEEFENKLITLNINKNEKSTIIETKSRDKNRASAISSIKKGSIAIASAPIGNRISARICRAKIGGAEISFSAVTN